MLSWIILLIEFIILRVIKLLGIVEISNILASAFIILFSLSFLLSVQKSRIFSEYFEQISFGYLIRILLLYFDLFGRKIHSLPQSGRDSTSYYNRSIKLALNGIEDSSRGFTFFMSHLFNLIGVNRLYGQFILLLLSIIAIIITIMTIERFDIEREIKTKIAWILCLLPNFALLSSIFLRESMATLLVTISVCLLIKWMYNDGSVFFLLAMTVSIVACLIHSGSIGITIGCIVCILIYDNKNQSIHATISNIVITSIIAIVASFLFLQYGDYLLTKFGKVESLADIANTNQMGGSSYAQYVGNSNNPVNMIVFTIPRIVYFLFSPFPWQWRGISDIIAFFFSGLFYLITIRNTILYLRKGQDTNRPLVICLLIIASICTFIFAWGVSNSGTASRHRDKMVCLYGLLYALTTNTYEGVKPNLKCSKYLK